MRYFLIFFSFIFFIGCNSPSEIETDPDVLRIGTFNIAWLGDTVDDYIKRSPNEYKHIADLIIDAKIDILAVQEVENHRAAEILVNLLPGYKFIVSKNGGKQNLCFIYSSDVIIDNHHEYLPLKTDPNDHRPGLIIQGKKGNFDWIMMNVHFKSTSRYDDTPEKKELSYKIRRKQAEIANNWADSVLQQSAEKDIFILGDFNDNPNRTKKYILEEMAENNNFEFITADLKSCKNKYWDSIDHIYISNSAKNRLNDNSVGMINFYTWMAEALTTRISDHCPVIAVFDVTAEDND